MALPKWNQCITRIVELCIEKYVNFNIFLVRINISLDKINIFLVNFNIFSMLIKMSLLERVEDINRWGNLFSPEVLDVTFYNKTQGEGIEEVKYDPSLMIRLADKGPLHKVVISLLNYEKNGRAEVAIPMKNAVDFYTDYELEKEERAV